MSKKVLLLLTTIVMLLSFAACSRSKSSTEFGDDTIGQIAQRFFPIQDTLPGGIETDFEHRETERMAHRDCETYFFRISFASEEEYRSFLDSTEESYADMTEQQCQESYFIIEDPRFMVDDFSFRAVCMDEFGQTDEQYVGLIGHCDQIRTIVYLYFWHELAGIETIDLGIGQHGYMDYYADLWSVE